MTTETEKLLTPAQAAGLLGISPYTLKSWRTKKYGPDWIALSQKTIRYDADEVAKFLEACQRYEGRRIPTLGRPPKGGAA